MKTRLFLFALMITSFSLIAAAQPGRNLAQRKHLHQGISRGSITRGEAIYLKRQQMHVRKDVRRARLNDGRIGPLERRHINRERKHLRRSFFVANHNRRVRI